MFHIEHKKRGMKAAALLLALALAGCGTAGGGTEQKAEKPAAKQEATPGKESVKEQESEPEQTATPGEEATPGNKKRRKVIIDTDSGADDAAALILAAKSENIEIVGVTTVIGNVDLEQSTKNALAALEIAGCDAPVYAGSDDTYTGRKVDVFSVFGEDGMGDVGLIHPKRTAEKEDAISFIIDTVRENPGEIEIISIGPATNIAKAMEKDRKAMRQVKRIWSMGTPGQGPGNASPVAEFNVYHDTEAYRVMLEFGVPVTVIGLDVCGDDALWTTEQFKKLKKSGEAGEFVKKSFKKLREFYQENGSEAVMNCDPVAVMCMVEDDFALETLSTHGSVITERGETYGQVIFYREGFTYDAAKNDYDYNVELVSKVDAKSYFKRFLKKVRE